MVFSGHGTKNPRNQALETIRRAAQDEPAAVAFIEALRWGGEPRCPHCEAPNVYAMKDRKTGERERNYRWRCRECGKMFSARTGTVFEETRLPLRVWCHAFWRCSASKKGVSALQISRECEITPKSALFLLHRIRFAMASGPDAPKLSGIVEADETYIGGKPRRRLGINPKTGKRYTGRGTKKTPVFAVVQRGGDVRLSKLDRITAPKLLPAIWDAVSQESTLMTDELGAYTGAGRRLKGGHYTVKHSAGQYVDGKNGEVHSNTAESVFSLIKRGLIGTFHSVSKEHLHRYLSEFEFRWNHRYTDDAQRTMAAIRGADGKRLMYRQPAAA